MSYHTVTFLVGAHRFGVPFPKLQIFSKIFWALHIYNSQYEKTIPGLFCVFVYLRSDNGKSIFSFLEQCSQGATRLTWERAIFAQKCCCSLALIYHYTLEKIPWKNYVRFWKWNLNVHPSRPKIRF